MYLTIKTRYPDDNSNKSGTPTHYRLPTGRPEPKYPVKITPDFVGPLMPLQAAMHQLCCEIAMEAQHEN